MYKIVASVIGATIFGIVAMAERAPAIEGELTSLSRAALKEAKLKPYAEVSFDGRDGTVTGYKRDKTKVEEGAQVVRDIYGVRVVDVVLKPNPPQKLEPKPQPKPQKQTPPADQPPRVRLQQDKGALVVSGKVASDAQKKDVLGACRAVWPEATITDQLTVDPMVRPMDAKWSESLGALSQVKQLKYDWTPDRLVIGGWVQTQDAQATLQKQLTPQSKALDNQTMVTPQAAEIKKAQRDINQFLKTKLISFETGSDVPTKATVGVLQKTATLLKQHPNTLIEVRGHTDNQGKPQDNKVLSQKRADAVVAQLIQAGVQSHRLFPIGFGDTKPIASNTTQQGRAKNRRVVFLVKGAQP